MVKGIDTNDEGCSCTGCYFRGVDKGCDGDEEATDMCVLKHPDKIWVEANKCEDVFFTPDDVKELLNESEIACRGTGLYKDLLKFTNQYGVGKIKEVWEKATGHKANYDTYIPFKMANGLTYIGFYKRVRLNGIVILKGRALKKCFFVNFNEQYLEVKDLKDEEITIKVITYDKEMKFELNK